MDEEDRIIFEGLRRHVRTGKLDEFIARGRAVGWCAYPVRLRGSVKRVEGEARTSVFSSVSLPDGVLLKACGTRKETLCPSCAAIYRDDARQLVRAGLLGGKGVDDSVSTRPVVFVTLTAPGYGRVHTRSGSGSCHPGRAHDSCSHGFSRTCRVDHDHRDVRLGTPLCCECYDYEGAVLQNASTSELWRRTLVYLPRRLAAVTGHTQREIGRTVRTRALRVVEFQRRGIVHVHAIVRLDAAGDAGEGGDVFGITAHDLARACESAARAVRVPHVLGEARWGDQLDVAVLERDVVRAAKIVSYLAKYATKSSSTSGALDRPIRSEEDLAARAVPEHLRRMAEASWRLGGLPGLGHLRRHSHMLGYGGHFLAKSPEYSTTFTALRAARAAWREAEHRHGGGVSGEGDEVSEVRESELEVESRFAAVGIGWQTEGEAIWARHQREQLAEERELAREDLYTPARRTEREEHERWDL